jgi:hypothetical protein
MMYIVVQYQVFPVNTSAEIEEAQEALRAAGLAEARVWVSPNRDPAEIEVSGDPDGYEIGDRLTAY